GGVVRALHASLRCRKRRAGRLVLQARRARPDLGLPAPPDRRPPPCVARRYAPDDEEVRPPVGDVHAGGERRRDACARLQAVLLRSGAWQRTTAPSVSSSARTTALATGCRSASPPS